jgi:hypothetical protein
MPGQDDARADPGHRGHMRGDEEGGLDLFERHRGGAFGKGIARTIRELGLARERRIGGNARAAVR